MSSNSPDHEIAHTVEVSTAAQLRVYADPLRMTLLDLVLERATTVADLVEKRERELIWQQMREDYERLHADPAGW